MEQSLEKKSAPPVEAAPEVAEAPAVEAAPEVSNTQVEELSQTAEAHVDQRAESFAPAGEARLDAGAKDIGMQSESFDRMREEEGLNTELASLDAESSALAATTKEEIATVSNDSETPEDVARAEESIPANNNEAASAEKKDEVPFAANSDALRRVTDGGRRPKVERKSISEGGTKYVPHSFENAEPIESVAPETISAHELPADFSNIASEAANDREDLATAAIEQPEPVEAPEVVPEEPTIVEEEPEEPEAFETPAIPEAILKEEPVAEPPSIESEEARVESKTNVTEKPGTHEYRSTRRDTLEMQQRLERAGIESSVIQTDAGGAYPEAIIFKKEVVPGEKTVRLYRGINTLDASVLKQMPYAMRARGQEANAEKMLGAAEKLAHEPTYDNLLNYVTEASPHLNADEQRRMRDDVMRMEDGVLEGWSVRRELVQKQIEHNGGVLEHGVTPYLSASTELEEAAGYGQAGVLIIDVPLSQIEEVNESNTEVSIKGALEKEYISGILIRDASNHTWEERVQSLERSVGATSASIETKAYDADELRNVRQQQVRTSEAADRAQWQKDVEQVRENRSRRLIRRFREMNLDYDTARTSAAEQGTDVYTGLRTTIYDHYATKLGTIGRAGRKPEDQLYDDGFGQTKRFDRNAIDDKMLSALAKTVEHLEEREEARAEARVRAATRTAR